MKGMKPDAMTVSGCVAEGTPAGHFMLNNATTMMPDAMKKEGIIDDADDRRQEHDVLHARRR